MQDILSTLAEIRWPRLLIRAARIGMAEYRRSVHLKRHLGFGALPQSGAALIELMEMESVLNRQRQSCDAAYSVARHVDIMIAVMGEARILRASYPTLGESVGH